MNLESNQLSLEQQFMHQVFALKVKDLSFEEAKELLIKFHKQMLFKDNFDRQLSSQRQKIAHRVLDN
ncbi:phycobilisome degradation protein nblA [Pleurocapsa sp. CCALA 161]|uniref:phycobilisome degradation protein nblA n=1 Tax=Pleurocapsa sp. CCALA 161 TaxID=2107688 RepID=UPI000D07C2A0|nr:phycobilisome degradation protein nblA [Pleurocapsa sp. CCALA 161]PSB05847.1 phycobilisome degradation protein nblA [Pleurocapsa sp. CCALA 161]